VVCWFYWKHDLALIAGLVTAIARVQRLYSNNKHHEHMENMNIATRTQHNFFLVEIRKSKTLAWQNVSTQMLNTMNTPRTENTNIATCTQHNCFYLWKLENQRRLAKRLYSNTEHHEHVENTNTATRTQHNFLFVEMRK